MRLGQQAGAEGFSAAITLLIGIALIATAAPSGNVRNIILGAALTLQGAIGVLIPRLLPPAPGVSAERVRARRVAAVIIPSGVVFLIAGVLLLLVLPERDSLTNFIIIGLIGVGALNVVSGFGAWRRANRPEPPANPNLTEHTPE